MQHRCLITQLSIILAITIMPGCSNFGTATSGTIDTRQDFTVAPELQSSPPMVVAILPFWGCTVTPEACARLRESFYSSFSTLHYKDIELPVIDAALRKAGIEPAAVHTADPVRLGTILGADALIYGEVTEYSRLFLIAYSNITVGLSAQMRSTRDGRILWAARKTLRSHAGGPFISPEGLVTNSFWAGVKIRDIERIRAAGNTTREIVKSIPNPEFQCYAGEEGAAHAAASAEIITRPEHAGMTTEKAFAQAARETPGSPVAGELSAAGLIAADRASTPKTSACNPPATAATEQAAPDTLTPGGMRPPDSAKPADTDRTSLRADASNRIEPSILTATEEPRPAVFPDDRDLRRAEESLQIAVEKQPDNHSAHCSLGFIYYQQGDFTRAIASLHTAAQLQPDHAGYHYNLGLAYMEYGLQDAAQRQWSMIPAHDPLWSTAQSMLTYVHARMIKEQ